MGPDRIHLVLVGLMGAGKTSVGRACAKRLDRRFVDLDAHVERMAGRTIAEIFAIDGEPAFRRLEAGAVRDVTASGAPLVIACGGGAVIDAVNRARLHDTGCVVWLRSDPAVLAKRTARASGTRPLLPDVDATATLTRLAAEREPFYAEVADAIVDSNDHPVETVATAVLEEYERCRG